MKLAVNTVSSDLNEAVNTVSSDCNEAVNKVPRDCNEAGCKHTGQRAEDLPVFRQ